MSKALKRVLSIIDRFETFCVEDVSMKNSAISFLNSLIVKVPQYVADWYDKTHTYNGLTDTLKLHHQTEGWLDKHDMTFNQLVQDIKRFGYVVTDDFDMVYIKAPSRWSSDELYIHLEESNGAHIYKTVFKKHADTFERQEAIKLMEDLDIKWELEEVE